MVVKLARRRSLGTERGFTLVELLMTISILGVLAAVVSLAVSGLTSRGGSAACSLELETIKAAQERARADGGEFLSEGDLVAGGFLPQASALYDVTVSGDAFDVIVVGECEAATSTTSAPSTGYPRVRTGGAPGVTVLVETSTGSALAGATVEYGRSSWTAIGVTDSSGAVNTDEVAGTHFVRIEVRSGYATFGPVTFTSGTEVTFRTNPVTIDLTGGSGDLAGAAIAHRGGAGYWISSDDTDDRGETGTELFTGTYDFRADFRGQTTLVEGVPVDTSGRVSIPLTSVEVRLSTKKSVTVEHRANNGEWVVTGVTSGGSCSTALLSGDYEFRATVGGSERRATATVSGSSMSVDLT